MTKTLSAIAILSAVFAGPAFAQDTGMMKPIHHGRTHDQRNFRGAYDQFNGPIYAAPRTLDRPDSNGFGFSGRDPSRVGGEDADLNPPGT